MPPGRSFSFDCLGGAREATVEVKLCSASMNRDMPLFTPSSAFTAAPWSARRAPRIWLASRSVGEGLRGCDELLSSSCGLFVMPEAGAGVVAATSRADGSSDATSYIGLRRCEDGLDKLSQRYDVTYNRLHRIGGRHDVVQRKQCLVVVK